MRVVAWTSEPPKSEGWCDPRPNDCVRGCCEKEGVALAFSASDSELDVSWTEAALEGSRFARCCRSTAAFGWLVTTRIIFGLIITCYRKKGSAFCMGQELGVLSNGEVVTST